MAKRLNTTIRREQIAEAALAIVAEQGVGALTARNVAKAVGVTAPALYRHFPGGKADILASVLDLLDSIKFQGLRIALEEPGSTLAKLKSCYDMHIETIQRYRALPNLILADTLWDEVPELRAQMYASHHIQQRMTAEIIAAGQTRGEIRNDISPDQIFVQFLGQFLTIAILYSRHENPKDQKACAEAGRSHFVLDLKAQAQASWDMFAQAVSPRPGPDPLPAK
jgi:AcrR family transcriptional regulator